MALQVREITAARLSDADVAVSDITSWFDANYRCAVEPTATFPTVSNLRDLLADSSAGRQRLISIVDTTGPTVVGLAVIRPDLAGNVVNHVRVRWLVAKPAQFGAIASALCSAILARVVAIGWTWANGVDIWGAVGRDTARTLFTDTGNFVVVPAANFAAGHPGANYPDGSVIRYTGA